MLTKGRGKWSISYPETSIDPTLSYPKRDCKLSSKVCCMQKIVYTAKLKVGQSSFTWIGQKNQINSGYNRLNLVNLLKLPPNTPIWCILRGFLREESWRKIL